MSESEPHTETLLQPYKPSSDVRQRAGKTHGGGMSLQVEEGEKKTKDAAKPGKFKASTL